MPNVACSTPEYIKIIVDRYLSTEDEARLIIVSERVRRLIPRVTVEDFEALAHMLEDVQHIELADIDRRRRLGID
jgi:hypothetical protein